jgi:hypothetical protein
MFGTSDNNRSQDQGGCREALSAKEGGGKGTTVGTRTGREAERRAKSVLGSAKSNCHRKTHLVEPDGAGREFMHLTRGGLWRESAGEVSRGHRSVEDRGNPVEAKGRRNRKARSTERLRPPGREVLRNGWDVATAAACLSGERFGPGWIPRGDPLTEGEPWTGRSAGVKRCAKP